ncbi:MAG: response regulator transcription factor [Bacteroidetes bacterium]|nr:response regulator transcription factor [Bacteroidota bacterium]
MVKKMNKLKILVVDDIPSMRSLVVQFLKKHQEIEIVGEATNGSEAVTFTREKQPDIVLVDVSLPDKSGLDVAKELKEHNPALGVYLFSAYDADEIRDFHNELPSADGFIHKANLKTELGDMIKKERTRRASHHS